MTPFSFAVYRLSVNMLSGYYAKKITNRCASKAERTNGEPIGIADAKNGVEVLEILEKASESLLTGGGRGERKEENKRVGRLEDKKTEVGSQGFFAHHSAEIDEGSTIDSGTKIWHFSHILSGSSIGKNCNIGQNVVIGPDVTIGRGCKIQNNISVYKGVTLEDGIFCGPSMVFTNIYNPRAEIRKMDQVRPTLIKKGATLGANCTIVCGINIGCYAFVGAGAVVTKNVLDHALVVGNSARQIGWVCKCGERLIRKSGVEDRKSDFETLECMSCGNSYQECETGIKNISLTERAKFADGK